MASFEEESVRFHAARLVLNQRMRLFGCEERVLGERVFPELPNEILEYIFETFGNTHFLMCATLVCKRMSDFALLNRHNIDGRERIPKLMNAITTVYTRDIDLYDNLNLRNGRLVRFQRKWSGPYWRVDVRIRPYGKPSGFDTSGDCDVLCIGHAARMHFIRFLITHPMLV